MNNSVVFIRSSSIYNDSRATKEILALSEAGYRVVVLGWDRSGRASEETKLIFPDKNVELRFLKVSPSSGAGIKQIHKLLAWFFWTQKQVKMIPNIRALHLCDLDAGVGVIRFAKRNNVPIIYDIYDYYVDSRSIPNILKPFVERMEINLINNANTTIICTEERREQITKANPNKVVIINNSPDIPLLKPSETKYDYAYCGSLFEKRLIAEIFEQYPKNSKYKFAIGGYGKYQSMAEILSINHENFLFFGSVPYETVIKIESESKVLSAIYDPSLRNHRLCAPNKFYEALALGKPLIVCKDTGIDRIVAENNIGIIIDYDATKFYYALEMLVTSPEMCKDMGRRARRLYEQNYKWEYMKLRLLSIYDEI